MPLPRLWRILDGFKKRDEIKAGKAPLNREASKEYAAAILPSVSMDCLPLPMQAFLNEIKEEGRRCRTNSR